jgi:hypothetical protein
MEWRGRRRNLGGAQMTALETVLRPTVRDGRPNFNCVVEGSDGTDVFNDDLAILWLQYSTQWVSLAHVGALFDLREGRDTWARNGF